MKLPGVHVRVTGNFEVTVAVGETAMDAQPGTQNPQNCQSWPVSPVSSQHEGRPVFRLPPYKVEAQFVTLAETLDWYTQSLILAAS